MSKLVVIIFLFFSSVNLIAGDFDSSHIHNEDYSFGQNNNKSFSIKIQKSQLDINFSDVEVVDPANGLWDFLFSAKDRKGFVGVLLMMSNAGSAAVALGESGGKQNNFLLGAVALGSTGLYLYNSHLNENKTPRRKKEKKKYKSSDWEIAEE